MEANWPQKSSPKAQLIPHSTAYNVILSSFLLLQVGLPISSLLQTFPLTSLTGDHISSSWKLSTPWYGWCCHVFLPDLLPPTHFYLKPCSSPNFCICSSALHPPSLLTSHTPAPSLWQHSPRPPKARNITTIVLALAL